MHSKQFFSIIPPDPSAPLGMHYLFGGSPEGPSSPATPPPPLVMQEVAVRQTFPGQTPDEVFALVFSKALAIAFQESQGNTAVEVGEWEDTSSPADTAAGARRLRRRLKYVVPMNVPLPKIMTDTMGLMDTVTENTEEAVVRDGAYVVTATCVLSGPPMISNALIQPVFTIRRDDTDATVGVVDCHVQFSFNVWGLATVVEATMEAGVRKGFEDMLALARRWADEGRGGSGSSGQVP